MALHLIVDLLLVLVVAFCGWRGYRQGLIISIFGLGAIIISLVVGNAVANVYAPDLTEAIEPFATGLMDSTITNVLSGDTDENGNTIELIEPSLRNDVYTVSYTALRKLGLCDGAARIIAQESAENYNTMGQNTSDALARIFSRKVAYVACFAAAFLLALIAFTVVGNVLDLRFNMPGLEFINGFFGTLLGLAKGIVFIVFLTLLLRYAGILISEGTLNETWLAGSLMNNNLLANLLNV